MTDWKDIRVVVTGGSSGIGAAVVAGLVKRGARVAILDLNIGVPGEGVITQQCDVAKSDSVQSAIDEVTQKLGGIDVLVNNAGVGAMGDIEGNKDEEWLRVLDVNVVGIARVSAAALPHLRKSKTPTIVNTASMAATHGLPQRALYSASKGAVVALTRAMAADHLREGIRVNCVSPGTADTPWVGRLLDAAQDPKAERLALEARQPHGRLVTAAEVAASIIFLADPENGSTTGTLLPVDGGMHDLLLRTES